MMKYVVYVTSDYDPFNSVTRHEQPEMGSLEDHCNVSRLCMFYKMTHNQTEIPYQQYILKFTLFKHNEFFTSIINNPFS